jgi:CubicO group peptidase (beta-lactamase class C family)
MAPMWRARVVCLVLCTAVACPASVAAQNRAALESELDRIRRDLEIPAMSAAVVEGGTIVWIRHFGVRAGQGQRVAYPIASLTKPFTAALAMIAITRGKLTLDQPVLVDASLTGAPAGSVRIRHLLSHTAAGTPGTRFLYSSALFRELARPLELALGTTFLNALTTNVITPLGLSRTTAGPALTPSGGLTSTIEDVARLAIALERGTLLSRDAATMMLQPPRFDGGVASPYAHGWFVQQIGGEQLRWHFGQQADASSLLVTMPRRRLSLVVLARGDRLSAPFWLQFGDVRWSPPALAFLTAWARMKVDLPEARRLMLDALAALGSGRAGRGVSLATKAIALAPALVNAGDGALLAAFARAGDPGLRTAGRAIARRLLAADGNHPRVLLDLAVLELQDKQPAEAAKLLRRVLDEKHATPEIARAASELLGQIK